MNRYASHLQNTRTHTCHRTKNRRTEDPDDHPAAIEALSRPATAPITETHHRTHRPALPDTAASTSSVPHIAALPYRWSRQPVALGTLGGTSGHG